MCLYFNIILDIHSKYDQYVLEQKNNDEYITGLKNSSCWTKCKFNFEKEVPAFTDYVDPEDVNQTVDR